MKISEKVCDFLMPLSGQRIKLSGVVKEHITKRVKHNSRGNKHNEHFIVLEGVVAEINNKKTYIKKYMEINYNFGTSKFSEICVDDKVEFYARIDVLQNELYISYPSKIKKQYNNIEVNLNESNETSCIIPENDDKWMMYDLVNKKRSMLQWINKNKKRPKNYQKIIAYTERWGVVIGIYSEVSDLLDLGNTGEKFIYWMPTPKEPVIKVT